MSLNFLDIPAELRNIIYEHLLVFQHSVEVFWEAYRFLERYPQLLLANKAVYHEANPLLYAKNCFDFAICTSDRIDSFLNQIGRINASHIRHTNISFSKFRYLDQGNAALKDNSIRILAKIQSDCTNLSTLRAFLFREDVTEILIKTYKNLEIVLNAFRLVGV